MSRVAAEALKARLFWVTLAASAGLLLALGHPLFLGQVYVGTDLESFYIPFRAFYHACLAAGDRFVWWPDQFGGVYLHGEGQAGFHHPLTLLLYRLLPFELAFNLEFLRSYLFLFVGVIVYLRRVGVPRDAAAFGAMVFTFCSFNLMHYMHLNVVACVAHIPWLLTFIDVALRSESRRRSTLAYVGIALTTASQLLISHPQFVWMSLLTEGAVVIFIVHGTRRFSGLVPLIAAKLLGALCASTQLLPVWETLWNSSRAAPPEGYVAAFPLHPLDLLQLVSPYRVRFGSTVPVNTENSLYMGALMPTLLVWLFLRRRELGAWRGPVVAAALVSAVSLWLALGHYGGLYNLQALLPVVGLFRVPARYTMIFQLAATFLMTIAFMDLRNVSTSPVHRSWKKLWPLLIPAILGVLATALAGRLWDGPFSRMAAPMHDFAGTAIVLVCAALVMAVARGRRELLVPVVLLTALDLGLYGMSWVWHEGSLSIAELAREHPPPGGDAGAERLADYRLLAGDPQLGLSGVRQLGGYVAMVPDRRLAQPDPVLGFEEEFDKAFEEMDAATRIAMMRVASVGWAEDSVPDPLPRVRLVTRTAVSADAAADIGAIDVETTALLEEPVPLAGGAPGWAAITRDKPGELRVAIEADTRQLLVVSESFHPGWRAEVDGHVSEVLRAYGDFMAVVVEPGTTEVFLDFDPENLRLGGRLSALGLAVAGLWLVAGLLIPRRESVSARDARPGSGS